MYDMDLRVGEFVQVDVEIHREGDSELYLPAHIQEDYPNENSPDPVTMQPADDTARLLGSYLNSRWKGSPAVFPLRSAERITTQGVRDMPHEVTQTAKVRPFKFDGSRDIEGCNAALAPAQRRVSDAGRREGERLL